MKINVISMLIMTFLSLIGCGQVDEIEKTVDISDNLIINVSATVNGGTITRAGMSTEQLNSFGLFIKNSNSTAHSYSNVYLLKSGNGTFKSQDYTDNTPVTMYWQNSTTAVEMVAYAPYHAAITDDFVYNTSVAKDQHTKEDIEHSDFVYQKQMVDPSKDRDSEGKVSIEMMHQLSKMTLTISLNTEFYQSNEQNPISQISIMGTKTECEFKLNEGILQNITAVNAITPYGASYQSGSGKANAVAVYEAILVPQEVDAGNFQIALTVEGVPYVYKIPSKVILSRDTQHSLSIKVEPEGVIATEIVSLPWGDGEEVEIMPDLTEKIELNVQASTIPDKAKLDAANRLLHFSYRGGVAQLAFNGDFDKKLTTIHTDSRLTITSGESKYKNTNFIITASQPEEGESYTATFRLTNALLTYDKGIEMTIRVDANRIPSVQMGGLEWMAYNGVGQNVTLYRKLEVDQTVRDIYREHWRDYTAMCMWGVRVRNNKPLLYPWEVVNTSNPSGNLAVPNLWNATIPCPVGWRLPTEAELSAIWPANNTSATATYVRNGITYTPTIEPSGAPPISVEGNPDIETNLYVISDGNGELIFPIAGWRDCYQLAERKSLMALDTGKAFYLWTANIGSAGWLAKILGINEKKISLHSNSDNRKATIDAYQSVRCVRNLTN